MPRVLIVDDEPGIRFALKRWFERQEWTVVEASDGPGAVALLFGPTMEATLDLIVCDLNLPGVTGEEIVHRLRDERPSLVGRTILTTGDTVADAEATSVLATHPHVLQKPFDLSTLRATLERLIGS